MRWLGGLLVLSAWWLLACGAPRPAPLTPTPPAPPPTAEATPSRKATATPSPLPIATTPPLRASPIPTAAPELTATPAIANPTPATPSPRAAYGGRLELATPQDIRHLDVHQEASPALATWGPGIVYSRLLRFRSGPDVALPDLTVECELCRSWELESPDTYVFRLREGVRWQALPPVDGRPLTAEDVAFSYRRIRTRGFPNAALLRGVREVSALDDGRLKVVLGAPDADFLRLLADGHAKVVAPEAVALHGDLKQGPVVGSGAWVWQESRPGIFHRFDASPDYFEGGLPYLAGLTINIIPEAESRQAAFLVGRLDVVQIDPWDWQAFRRRAGDTPFLQVPEAGVGLEVGLRADRPPMTGLRVRRALMYAHDPWRAVEEAWGGLGYVSVGFPLPAADWYLPEEELRRYFADPDKARRYLDEAGVGLPLPVTLTVGEFQEPYLRHAEILASEMAAVGFEPTIQRVDRRTFGEKVWVGGEYQVFVGPPAPVTTTNGYLLPVLHSRGAWNSTGYKDRELDALIEAQAVETDPGRRRRLLLDVQRQVLEKGIRFMAAGRVTVWAYRRQVRGLYPNVAGFEYAFWARVWLGGGGRDRR